MSTTVFLASFVGSLLSGVLRLAIVSNGVALELRLSLCLLSFFSRSDEGHLSLGASEEFHDLEFEELARDALVHGSVLAGISLRQVLISDLSGLLLLDGSIGLSTGQNCEDDLGRLVTLLWLEAGRSFLALLSQVEGESKVISVFNVDPVLAVVVTEPIGLSDLVRGAKLLGLLEEIVQLNGTENLLVDLFLTQVVQVERESDLDVAVALNLFDHGD